MLQKLIFRHDEAPPLLYEITKRKKTQFQITIPKKVFRTAFKEYDEEKLKTHFDVGKCIEYDEHGDFAVLSFDVSNHCQFIMRGLNRIFLLLNNEHFLEIADASRKQTMTCHIAHTGLAVSFAPWMHEYFKNMEHASYFFSYAKSQMQEMQQILLKKNKYYDWTECDYTEDGFKLSLFGSGLWLAGSYSDNKFDTHNCDTSIDQTVFFTGCVALCDSLKHFLKTDNYLL